MNKKRWIVVAVLACMMLFVSSGMAYVRQTIHQYNGTCSKLTGFPAMLQRMNFFQTGGCPTQPDGVTCATPSSVCTLSNEPSSTARKGKCTQHKDKQKINTGCVCQ